VRDDYRVPQFLRFASGFRQALSALPTRFNQWIRKLSAEGSLDRWSGF
jgi:hypothetical protein